MPTDHAAARGFSAAPTRTSTVVRWLIALNVGVWFLQLTLISAPDVRALLGFATSDLNAWWTVVTYQFVHGSATLLAINMYALWLFGTRVELEWGSAQFAWYYVLCGVGGWLFQLLFVREGILIGSLGGVMAVVLAHASRWGDERVMAFGVLPMSTRWLAGLFILANLAVGLANLGDVGVSYLAHFGSLAAGWAYLRMAGSMDIERLRRHVASVADEPDDVPPRAIPPRSAARPRGEGDARDVDEIVQQSKAAIAERSAKAPLGDAPTTESRWSSAAELNALLDKISARGLEALTQAERDRLEDAARRLRGS